MGEWPKPMWLWKMKKTKWGKCRILNLGEQKSQRIMYVNVYFCGGEVSLLRTVNCIEGRERAKRDRGSMQMRIRERQWLLLISDLSPRTDHDYTSIPLPPPSPSLFTTRHYTPPKVLKCPLLLTTSILFFFFLWTPILFHFFIEDREFEFWY